jgi:DNA-binding GntR family transcriptional regulator
MLSAPSTPPDPQSLKAAIARELRERIARGVLPLGGRISDKAIAEELRVSRTPVREALLQLAGEHLVVVQPQRGTFVFAPATEQMRELCELRGVLESGAARLLAGRGDRAAAAELAAIVQEARQALARRQWEACGDLDTRFHEVLVGRCGNRLLAESYRAISDQVRALRRHLPHTRERVARGLDEHAAIAKAIAGGNGERAAVTLSTHVENVRRLLEGRLRD